MALVLVSCSHPSGAAPLTAGDCWELNPQCHIACKFISFFLLKIFFLLFDLCPFLPPNPLPLQLAVRSRVRIDHGVLLRALFRDAGGCHVSTVANTGVQIPFRASVFLFFGEIPRSGVAESHGGSIFRAPRLLLTACHGGCIHFCPPLPAHPVTFGLSRA